MESQRKDRRKAEPPGKDGSKLPDAPAATTKGKPEPPAAQAEEQTTLGSSFPVVGIGASAGGLEASTELLKGLPADTGMAFVFVHHLAREHESLLVDILARATPMPVSFASDGARLEPNHVYVIPPDAFLAVFHGTLNLVRQERERGERTAIDYFFQSLAEDQRNLAIGVVLSGTGSDGALGVRAVKADDGIAIVQDPESAAYDGMPRAAIATGTVDFVLAPKDIARELARIARHPLLRPEKEHREPVPEEKEERQLERIFLMLREAAGVDFTYYKSTTVKRRIGRRMVVHHIESLGDYATYLGEHADEIASLYKDLLINVTEFFREPESFEALKSRVFPHLIEHKGASDPVRIWVPGCSTGEEPYSIAMALTEFLDAKAVKPPIQIFATDISDASIEHARQAVYPDNIVSDIAPERLSRFFVRTEGGYQVNKAIRDACVFAKHDVTRDPPFSRIDLISCRNLLIYLGRVIQRRLIPVFHYALSPSGFLFLGSSENVGDYADLFESVDSRFKIYAKRPNAVRPPLDFGFRPHTGETIGGQVPHPHARAVQVDVQKEADRVAIDRFVPPGVLIDEDMQIVQFRGDTSAFLRHAPGRASLDLLSMARKGLDAALRSALPPVGDQPKIIRIPDVGVEEDSQTLVADVEIVPLPKTADHRHFLVFFKEPEPLADPAGPGSGRKARPSELERLRQDLTRTRDQLRVTIEEKDASVEGLRAANEEIQSSNEELQSINEELETAKEELQSTNEELTTLNEELQNRNFELLSMNDDFRNVLSSVNIPIIILGKDLQIRRYTPMAERVLSLIPADVGRPITDLKLKIDVPDLPRMIGEVVQHLGVAERDVRDEGGRQYRLQIRPYRTSEDRIEGVVITMLDIEDMRSRQAHDVAPAETREDVQAYVAGMLETMLEPFVVLDDRMRIVGSSAAFAAWLGADAGDLGRRRLDEIGARREDAERLVSLATEAEQKGKASGDISLALPVGERRLRVNAGRIERTDAGPLILLGMSEI